MKKDKFIVEVGDKVAYSVQFLRSIGMSHSDMAHAKGVVTKLDKLGEVQLAHIDWGNDEIPPKVIVPNLAKVGPNRRFCNVD